ncbi:MAG: hypothetical protein HY902_20200, partial [Deltaproteobacteria bacterium]|nr:hypothetical protein [Deltaproteobacteria bacterium]
CTADSCDAKTGCAHSATTAGCQDGDPCTLGDVCSDGACSPGPAKVCDDSNPCTDDSCDKAGQGNCLYLPNTATCSTADLCLVAMVCGGGSCGGGKAKVCDDGNLCTFDACDSNVGCVNTAQQNGKACDDGDGCSEGDTCQAGACKSANAKDCSSLNSACATGTCKAASSTSATCVAAPKAKGVPCNDGKFCSDGDGCDGNGACAGGPPMDCAAVVPPGEPCKVASCDETKKACVVGLAVDGTSCEDGTDCTWDAVCKQGSCMVPGVGCGQQSQHVPASALRSTAFFTGAGHVAVQGSTVRWTGPSGSCLAEPGVGPGSAFAAVRKGVDSTYVLNYSGVTQGSSGSKETKSIFELSLWQCDLSAACAKLSSVAKVSNYCEALNFCNWTVQPPAVAMGLLEQGSPRVVWSFIGSLSYPSYTPGPYKLYLSDVGQALQVVVPVSGGPHMAVVGTTDGTGDSLISVGCSAAEPAFCNGDGVRMLRHSAGGVALWSTPPAIGLSAPPMATRIVPQTDGKSWVIWQGLNADGEGQGIAGQRISADGALLGKPSVLSAVTSGDQVLGDVVRLDDSSWVLAYSDSSVLGSGKTRIRIQRFSASGVPIGASFLADVNANGTAVAPALAGLGADGGYSVVWGESGMLWSRMFSKDGKPLPGIAERRVNSSVAGDQSSGRIAVGSGGAVAVFLSPDATGSLTVVRARAFDGLGKPVGPDTVISNWPDGLHAAPTVAAGSAGYVAAWTAEGQDGSGDGVFAAVLDSKGKAVGSPFGLASETKNAQTQPSVAMSADGSWVAAWTHQTGTANGTDVRWRRFDAQNSPQGPESAVHSTSSGLQAAPAAVAMPGGGYVVAWQSQDQDGSGLGVFARRFSATGTALTDESVVNNSWTVDQRRPALAAADDKTLLVCWESYGQDAASTWGVYCRLLDPKTLLPLADEFKPHALTAGQQWQPVVTAEAGHYAVVWTTDGLDPGTAVQLQRYDTTGKALGAREQANRYVTGDQSLPFAAYGPDALWVGWQSQDQDGSGLGLFLRRLPSASDVP